MTQKHSHYFKPVPPGVTHIDVYRVLEMFKVTDQCLGHAMKKLLVAGGRGAGKNIDQDIQEAIDSLLRWQAMQTENNGSPVADSERYDIDKVLDSALPEAASLYPNTTIFHIDKALNDTDIDVRYAAIQHPNVTSAHISKALDDDYPPLRMVAIRHPKVTAAHIDKAMNDINECIREAAMTIKKERKL